MAGLRALYQELILDHNRRPRNFRRIEPCSHHAQGYNPLCGDRIDVFLQLEEGRITDVAFEGDGCAISTASASLMTEALRGLDRDQAQALFEGFHELLAGAGGDADALGSLGVLAGVRDFPSRVKCATLPWHALRAALDRQASASTET